MAWVCKENCGASCCGVVEIDENIMHCHENDAQITPTEVIRNKDTGKVIAITEDMQCIFLNRQTKKCAIYEDRPEICRKYGTVYDVPCPFIDINGKPRSEKNMLRTQNKIDKFVDGVALRTQKNPFISDSKLSQKIRMLRRQT